MLSYRNLDKPFNTIDVSSPATLLLGTFADFDHVRMTLGANTWSLTAAEASSEFGRDVTTLGRDEAKLRTTCGG